LLALPAAFERFNGFYASYPDFVLFNSMRILTVEAIGVLALLSAGVWLLIRFWKRRRRKKTPTIPPQNADVPDLRPSVKRA